MSGVLEGDYLFFYKNIIFQNAYDFIQLDKGWIRKNMGVVGEKTYLELKWCILY